MNISPSHTNSLHLPLPRSSPRHASPSSPTLHLRTGRVFYDYYALDTDDDRSENTDVEEDSNIIHQKKELNGQKASIPISHHHYNNLAHHIHHNNNIQSHQNHVTANPTPIGSFSSIVNIDNIHHKPFPAFFDPRIRLRWQLYIEPYINELSNLMLQSTRNRLISIFLLIVVFSFSFYILSSPTSFTHSYQPFSFFRQPVSLPRTSFFDRFDHPLNEGEFVRNLVHSISHMREWVGDFINKHRENIIITPYEKCRGVQLDIKKESPIKIIQPIQITLENDNNSRSRSINNDVSPGQCVFDCDDNMLSSFRAMYDREISRGVAELSAYRSTYSLYSHWPFLVSSIGNNYLKISLDKYRIFSLMQRLKRRKTALYPLPRTNIDSVEKASWIDCNDIQDNYDYTNPMKEKKVEYTNNDSKNEEFSNTSSEEFIWSSARLHDSPVTLTGEVKYIITAWGIVGNSGNIDVTPKIFSRTHTVYVDPADIPSSYIYHPRSRYPSYSYMANRIEIHFFSLPLHTEFAFTVKAHNGTHYTCSLQMNPTLTHPWRDEKQKKSAGWIAWPAFPYHYSSSCAQFNAPININTNDNNNNDAEQFSLAPRVIFLPLVIPRPAYPLLEEKPLQFFEHFNSLNFSISSQYNWWKDADECPFLSTITTEWKIGSFLIEKIHSTHYANLLYAADHDPPLVQKEKMKTDKFNQSISSLIHLSHIPPRKLTPSERGLDSNTCSAEFYDWYLDYVRYHEHWSTQLRSGENWYNNNLTHTESRDKSNSNKLQYYLYWTCYGGMADRFNNFMSAATTAILSKRLLLIVPQLWDIKSWTELPTFMTSSLELETKYSFPWLLNTELITSSRYTKERASWSQGFEGDKFEDTYGQFDILILQSWKGWTRALTKAPQFKDLFEKMGIDNHNLFPCLYHMIFQPQLTTLLDSHQYDNSGAIYSALLRPEYVTVGIQIRVGDQVFNENFLRSKRELSAFEQVSEHGGYFSCADDLATHLLINQQLEERKSYDTTTISMNTRILSNQTDLPLDLFTSAPPSSTQLYPPPGPGSTRGSFTFLTADNVALKEAAVDLFGTDQMKERMKIVPPPIPLLNQHIPLIPNTITIECDYKISLSSSPIDSNLPYYTPPPHYLLVSDTIPFHVGTDVSGLNDNIAHRLTSFRTAYMDVHLYSLTDRMVSSDISGYGKFGSFIATRVEIDRMVWSLGGGERMTNKTQCYHPNEKSSISSGSRRRRFDNDFYLVEDDKYPEFHSGFGKDVEQMNILRSQV